MILSNLEIQRAIDEGALSIDPEPLPRSGEGTPYDSCAVDLHLDSHLAVPKPGLSFVFDLKAQKPIAPSLAAAYEEQPIHPEHGFRLDPNKFVLGTTIEVVSLPFQEPEKGACLAARIEGRSSLARCGLIIHFTAPTIHAGFSGTITLEMINLGNYPIQLYPGTALCQLIVEPVSGRPFESPSEFQNQSTPTGL
jgi:dCTP deaminase